MNTRVDRVSQYLVELEAIERVLAQRKIDNGIEYYVPNPKQYKFHCSVAKRLLYVGSNRCLGGETKIYDPIKNKEIPVSAIDSDFHVMAFNGKRLVVTKALKPFKKDIGSLYKVTLRSGESFVCSDTHVLLTSDGFQPLSQLQVGFSVFHPLSSEALSHLIHISNGEHFEQTIQDSLSDYLEGFDSCDEQPHQELNNDLNVSPLQGDVQGHTSSEVFERKDDLAYKLTHNRFYQSSDHPSILDVRRLHEVLCVDTLCPPVYTVLLLTQNERRIAYQSMLVSYPRKSNVEQTQHNNQPCSTMPSNTPNSISSYSDIISITYLRKDVKWDFEVPEYHNYYACGAIHHNSGKTEGAVAEVLFHLLGWYPEWGEYNGVVYDYPKEKRYVGSVKVLWISPQFEHILKFVEPKFDKFLPKDKIVKKPKRNSDGSLKHMEIRHSSGGISVIDFASQEQPLMAFEGSDYDIVVADEPLARPIFTAVARGLVDRGGKMIMVFTPITEQWIKEDICDKADGKFIELFQADIMDNLFNIKGLPILNKEYIKEFEKLLSDDEKETRLRGRWYHMSGMVFKELDKDVHVVDDHKVPQGCPIYFIIDPHDRNPHWGIWVYLDKCMDAYVCGEMIKHGEPKEYSKAVLEYEKANMWKVRKRIIDPNFGNKPKSVGSNIRVIDLFRTSGLNNLILGNDEEEAGKLLIRTALKFDKSKPVSLTNRPKLYFYKNAAKESFRSLSNFQYEDWTKKSQEAKGLREKAMERNKHIFDCIKYFYNSNPRYEQIKVTDDLDKPIY